MKKNTAAQKILELWSLKLLIALVFFIGVPKLFADTYPITSPHQQVVGKFYQIDVQPGEVAYKLARKHRVGMDEFSEANPQINKYWLKSGQQLNIPREFILPAGAKDGIVINLAEKRLYFYSPNSNNVTTYPVTVGRQGWSTPVVDTTIIQKREKPTWVVPESILEYSRKKGKILPKTMPPGPNNPLGEYALRLGIWTVLIHGTNKPYDIGLRLSSGCIRLHPDDIKALYGMVPLGSKVRVVDEPYKVAVFDNHLYFEAHMSMNENWTPAKKTAELKRVFGQYLSATEIRENWDVIMKIANMKVGFPLPVIPYKGHKRPVQVAFNP